MQEKVVFKLDVFDERIKQRAMKVVCDFPGMATCIKQWFINKPLMARYPGLYRNISNLIFLRLQIFKQ